MILHDKYGFPFSDKHHIYQACQDKALGKKKSLKPRFLGSIEKDSQGNVPHRLISLTTEERKVKKETPSPLLFS